ncbi:hypothetical protein [Paenibacillus sp. TY11]|uniref:hypothetical protein n=1 Tax=Paenibacillus sp. TY11 TaxID=3448633 RepID=UPI00403A6C53
MIEKELMELISLEMVNEFVENHELSFLYVSRTDCSISHAVLPKLRELLDHYPLIRLGHINAANQVEHIAEKYTTTIAQSLRTTIRTTQPKLVWMKARDRHMASSITIFMTDMFFNESPFETIRTMAVLPVEGSVNAYEESAGGTTTNY